MAEPTVRPEGPGSLLALTVVGASATLNLYSTQPLLPLLGRTLGVPPVAAALTVSATTVAVALGSPLAGWLAGRYGRRRTIVAALFALVVPTLLAATSRGIADLWAWRFLQGLAVPGIYAVGIAYATVEWQAHGVGRAMASLMTGNVLGGFLGRLVAATAAARASWRAAFLALGAVTLAAALAVRHWLPPGSDRPGPARSGPRAGPAGWGWLLEPPLLATLAVGMGTLFTNGAMFTYVTFHLSAPPFSLSVAAIGWLFAVYLVGAAVLPFLGRWLDELGSRRAVAASTLVTLLGMGLTLLPSLAAVAAGLVLVSTAAFVANAAATAHLAVAAPPAVRSAAAGAYVSSYYLGGALGAVLPGAAWHRGGWPATVAFNAAVLVLATAGALIHWRRPRVP
ncbi:MAG: MFS transporter [Deltaproteobacteria bacterium]|nr:MFS transporter [Deltaproteobacteria bacterium]